MKELVAPDEEVVGDNIVGEKDASPSIIFYGDYDCTECMRLHDVLTSIVDDDGIAVRYIFRNLTLVSAEHEQYRQPIAAEAAAEQGKFWEMHHALFRNKATDAGIESAAREAALDIEEFETACRDPALMDRVKHGIDEAKSREIDRVPTLIVRGREYFGTWDEASIRRAVVPPVARQIKEVASQFAEWAAASGAILVAFALLALLLRNSPLGELYYSFWEANVGFVAADQSLVLSLHH